MQVKSHMSPHTINLRSESPSVMVEFELPPGSHAWIGAAPDAEVSLPLAGLADFAGMIARTEDGALYVTGPTGQDSRFIQLPAALSLPPYHFAIFQPPPPTSAAPPVSHKQSGARTAAIATAGLVVIAVGTSIFINLPSKQALPPITSSRAAPTTPTVTPPEIVAPVPTQPEIVDVPTHAEPVVHQKLDLETLAERIAPAVFRVEVKDAKGEAAGTGTAFAISADGIAVTNFHVVEGGNSFAASTNQGAQFNVSRVIATDPAADLALIQIQGSNLPSLELGDSGPMKIGAPVAVYGSPLGLPGTLSEGILSAKRSALELDVTGLSHSGPLLQISAPISPGSSGSPVIDGSGKVIGVVVSTINGKAAQNLNFVIPVEAVVKLRRDSESGIASNFLKPPISAEPKDPESIFLKDSDFQRLNRYYTSGNWIESLKLAKALAARHQKSWRAHLAVGASLNKLGLNREAETELELSLSIFPENSSSWGLLGNIQASLRKLPQARESWKRAAGIDPSDAGIWKAIAESYLVAGEFIDAIAPLEVLRGLDRGKFESILDAYRKFGTESPELNAMLIHFAAATPSETHSSSPPSDIKKLAQSLVQNFLNHGAGPDIRAEMADYASSVAPYFDRGRLSLAEIEKDLRTYRSQWPQRSYRFLALESSEMIDARNLHAVFQLQFSATDGKKTRTGILKQSVRFTSVTGGWLISGIQTLERVK